MNTKAPKPSDLNQISAAYKVGREAAQGATNPYPANGLLNTARSHGYERSGLMAEQIWRLYNAA